jgi:hypothetical protein
MVAKPIPAVCLFVLTVLAFLLLVSGGGVKSPDRAHGDAKAVGDALGGAQAGVAVGGPDFWCALGSTAFLDLPQVPRIGQAAEAATFTPGTNLGTGCDTPFV